MADKMSQIVSRFLKYAKRGMPNEICKLRKNKTPQFCVEACIYLATNPKITDKDVIAANLKYGEVDGVVDDHPTCVNGNLSSFKIYLNDCAPWSSAKERARYLIRIGIAQIGSNKTFKRSFEFEDDFAEYVKDRSVDPHIIKGHPDDLTVQEAIEVIFHLENFLVKRKVKGALWLRANGHRYKGIPKRKALFKGFKA
jgi:hypothetical protein